MKSRINKLINKLSLLIFLLASSSVQAQLQSDFSSNVKNGCTPLTVKFEDQSNQSNLKYYWTFGNGNTSTKKNPQAIYYKPGIYEVTLQVTNTSSQTSKEVKTAYIQVFKNPKADFEADILKGCLPLATNFKDKSTKGDGAITKWLYDFGDGTTSKKQNIQHSYQSKGLYPVSLVVIDANGCQDKTLKDKYINALATPIIDISFDKSFSCTAPFDVQFTDKSKDVSSGDTYLWDFGDGKTSTAKNPKHTYTFKGEFDVTLTITKSNGCKGSKTFKKAIYIGDIQVDFSATPKSGCIPHEVTFISTVKPNIKGFKYKWDFGDGKSAIGFNALHTYEKSGSYTVKLTVSDDGKCPQTETKINYIKVGTELKADFTTKDTFSCKIPFLATFLNTSKGGVNYKWEVESNSFTGKNMTYNFISYGKYKVKLTTSNFDGCEDVIEKWIDVLPLKAELNSDKSDGCIPLEVNFEDVSDTKEEIVKWEWDFGDGSSNSNGSTKEKHTFTKEGEYVVKLKIISKNGCEATTQIKIKAGKKITPNFDQINDTFCNGEGTALKNTTKDDTLSPINWSWTYSNSNDSKQFSNTKEAYLNIDHDTGWYDITLTGNHNGCISDTTFTNQFYVPAPKSKYIFTYDTCKQDSIKLRNTSLMGTESYWKYTDGSKVYDKDVAYVLTSKLPKPVSVYTIDTNSGCESELPIIIPAVERYVSAAFSYTGELCAPSEMDFIPSNQTKAFEYQWTDHDGVLDSNMSIKRSFKSAGDYVIKLVVKDTGSKCIDSVTRKISIKGPGVKGSVKGKPGCAPVTVELTCDTEFGDLADLYWQVGDDQVKIKGKGTIKHTILHPGEGGKVLIQLVGVDSNSCSGVDEHEIEVSGPKEIAIDVGRFRSCTGHQFIFSPDFDGADQTGYTFKWYFGDGDTSNHKVVNHTYAKDGSYPIALFVTDSFGCTSEWRDTLDLEKERLYADLAADSITTDCPPHFVQFFDRSKSPNRDIVSWEWDFGDGVKSKLKNPAHNYLYPGEYHVKLKIVDSWGCTDSIEYPNLVLVNGPEGSYSFDDMSGCVPVKIDFKSTNKDAYKVEWDFGDGNVISGNENPSHTYHDTGRFIPLLVLTDSFGCTFTLPPIDTIYVYPYPNADFKIEAECANEPVEFENLSQGTWGDTAITRWYFGDGNSDSSWNSTHQYEKPGLYPVKLYVESEYGCNDSLTKSIDLKGIEAIFELENDILCLGSDLLIKDISKSDTQITSIKWWINDIPDSGKQLTKTFYKVGPVKVLLEVKDANGCIDSLLDNKTITVGDTIAPDPIEIYRITVLDDYRTQLEFKPSDITDFKSYTVFRDHLNSKTFQTFDQEDTILVDQGLNTLKEVYCYQVEVENTCGKHSNRLKSDTDCSIEVSAKGGINHNALTWNAYSGWNNGVEYYKIHREDLNTKGLYHFLDSVPGSQLDYIDSNLFCDAEHFYKIEGIERNGNQKVSFSDTCAARPIYVNVVPPNQIVRATVEDDQDVLIEWKEAPPSMQEIDQYILHKSDEGTKYYEIKSNFDPSINDYLDKEVEVDDQSYFYKMKVIDVCNDTSPYSNLAKTILLKASTAEDQRPFVIWSNYQGWDAGVASYEIQIEEPDGSFSTLATSQSTTDTTWLDEVTDLNQRANYCYRVIGHKNAVSGEGPILSVSNVDCAPVVSKLFVPNAFTPNDDGNNDVFFTPGIYIKEFHIKIFNRWGEQVFESWDMYDNWDGTFNGEKAELEAYLYVIESLGVDDVKRSYSGTVTLLR